jgi:hypothetical protein
MSILLRAMTIVALLAPSAVSFSAQAGPIGEPLALATTNLNSTVQPVYWRGRGWGWGAPVAGGLVAGALIGGALASPYYAPGYYGPAYGVPAYGPPPDDGLAYCMQRYKSYDPGSGTYLGYDGYRHPCP